LTQLVDAAPEGDQWLHEIKYDGYRMHARLDGGRVKLLTRSGIDWTHKYPAIAKAMASLDARQPISTANSAAWAPTASLPSASFSWRPTAAMPPLSSSSCSIFSISTAKIYVHCRWASGKSASRRCWPMRLHRCITAKQAI
jgi:hypothetical protein